MKVKAAAIQLQIREEKEQNLKRALELLDEAIKTQPHLDVACLPEMFYKLPSPEDADKTAEAIPNELTKAFSKKAKEHGIYIVGGSFLERRSDGLYNTSLLFDKNGELKGSYSKVHLFDAFEFKESKTTKAGKALPVFDTDFGRIGITICYDLRFPEVYRTLALKGANLVLVPSAFIARIDHWETLVKAAALQNLMFIVAANLIGKHKGHDFFGRSMIVDPWGIPLSVAPDRECIIYAELDLEHQKELRRRLPVLEQRRPELYELG